MVGGTLRLPGADQEDRRRAAALYGRRAQGDARSVPAGKPDDVARLKALQREIHAIFIALVKQSRGSRLKGADDVLFTGEYWAGETSVSLGLADAIGDLRSTLRARYGEKVLTPVIAPAERDAVRPARPQIGRARARSPRWTVSRACRTS